MDSRLGLVFLYTENLEAIVPFYRDALELPVKSYEPGHSLWLQTDPVQIVLHVPEEPWYPDPYLPEFGGVLMWMQVDGDLEEMGLRLKEKGVEVLTSVMHSDRSALLLLKDPEGRRIGPFREEPMR